MVAPIRRLTMGQASQLPMAAGAMHAIVYDLAGKGIDEQAATAAQREGRAKDGLDIIGMPHCGKFFKEMPPTAAMGRAYLAECCRRWLAILEPKGESNG